MPWEFFITQLGLLVVVGFSKGQASKPGVAVCEANRHAIAREGEERLVGCGQRTQFLLMGQRTAPPRDVATLGDAN